MIFLRQMKKTFDKVKNNSYNNGALNNALFKKQYTLVAELADAPDLGSGGQPCRFKSCQG